MKTFDEFIAEEEVKRCRSLKRYEIDYLKIGWEACLKAKKAPVAEVLCSVGLSRALRALCLTRDYVGEKALPALKGWEWYDAGMEICKLIPDDEWAEQFKMRIAR